MFENLQEKLEVALKRFRGQSKITEENISDALNEIRNALLDADVNLEVVNKFIENIKSKAIGQEVRGTILPEQLIVKIVNDELIETLGSKASDLIISPKPPTVILIAGLQGSGKTTFAAKLAKYLRKKGKHPVLVAADIHRPAAILQLQQLADQIKIPVFTEENKSAVVIAKDAVAYAKKLARDIVIIDTAGRTTVDEVMMKEVSDISEAVQPTETLFVVDSMIGQDAVRTARAFNEQLNLTGIVLTKLDGDTRGGAALSVRDVVGKPIKFISTGEKLDSLEQFHPERIASRILGMGDIISLVEKAEQEIDEKEAEKMEEKLRKNQFTFDDFLDQIKMIKKMGPLKDLIGMLPGMDKQLRNVDIDDKAFSRIEAIILSMTKAERANPKIINGSRRLRISKGSGTRVQEVNNLLKQFEQMQKAMKNVVQGKRFPMMPKFPGMKF
ncbi:MAG TPA: signal recognition particle protein [Candidatus Kapabacteria bacterium]|jgi:signal recognition particle subunit SRP54|nr:signal recognition particle protein [Candidatus Kapabacteria bacterium]HOV92209.1 signal recognition particle protein [Candidatus Kapabacteria bacterium]